MNRLAKNDGSDPLVAVAYSNVFARGGESVNLPGGLPITAPPYAVLTAIDLNKGELAWRVPLGEGNQALRNHPLLKGVTLPDRMGSPNNRGGALVTKSGLVFIGGGDGYFYAFDSKTGREVSRIKIQYSQYCRSDDVPYEVGPPVHRHGHRRRRRQRAAGVCAAGELSDRDHVR